MKIPDSIDIEETFDILDIGTIYDNINLEEAFQNLDWNKVLKAIDWNTIAASLNWNELMKQQCAEAEQNNWELPNTTDAPYELPPDAYKCYQLSSMMSFSAINTSCLTRKIMAGEIDLIPKEGDFEAMCKMSECIDMNEMFKSVDLNCLYQSMDLNEIFKHYDFNPLIQDLKNAKVTQQDSFIDSRIEQNPLLKAIDVQLLSEQMDTDIGSLFSAEETGRIFDNLYDTIYPKLQAKVADIDWIEDLSPKDHEKMMRVSFSIMKGLYPDDYPLKYYIVYQHLLSKNGQTMIDFNFDAALETQELQQNILIEAYQRDLFDQLDHKLVSARTIMGENFEMVNLAGLLENTAMLLSHLGQHHEALEKLSQANQLRSQLIAQWDTRLPGTTYLEKTYSDSTHQELAQELKRKYPDLPLITTDVLDVNQGFLMHGDPPPFFFLNLLEPEKINLARIKDAFIIYHLLLDLALDKLRGNETTPTFIPANKMVDRVYGLKVIKGIYLNLADLRNRFDAELSTIEKDGIIQETNFYEEASPALDQLEQLQWQAVLLTQVGQVHYQMEHLEESQDTLEKAWDLMTSLPNMDFVVLSQLGFESAEQEFLNKTPLFITVGQTLAKIYIDKREFKRAETALLRTLDYVNSKPFFRDVIDSTTFNNNLFKLYGTLGEVAVLNNDSVKAEKYFTDCQDIAQKTQNELLLFNANLYWGSYHGFYKGNWTKASSYFETATKHAEVLGYQEALATVHLNHGLSAIQLGKTVEAEQLLEKALQHADAINNTGLKIQAHTLFGQLNEKRGLNQEALAAYEKAIELTENEILDSYQSQISQQISIAQRFAAYSGAVEQALELDQTERAFRLVQQSKARTLNRLFDSQESINENIPDELSKQLDDVRVQYKLTAIQEFQADSSKKDSLNDLLTYHTDQYEQLQAKAKRLANLPLDSVGVLQELLTKVQNNLGEGEALIDFFIGDSVHAFVISKEELEIVNLGATSMLNQSMAGFVKHRQSIENNWEDGPKKAMRNFSNSLQQLQQQLWTKLQATPAIASANRLIIIPDAQLYQLPIGAFLQADNEAIMQRHALNYFQSVSLFLERRELNPPRSNKGLQSILVVDKSNFEEDVYSNLKPLPALNQEAIKKIFPTADFLVDQYATIPDLKEKISSNESDILYVSSHAIVDENDPGKSFVAFSDGPLTLYETFAIKLDFKLAILSACELARGEFQRGAGVQGFTRGLMHAGNKSVLVSLWEIPPVATELLVNQFLAQIKEGIPAAEALSQAQQYLRTLDGGKYDNPFYWGAFILFGEY